MIKQPKTTARQKGSLTMLLLTASMWAAACGNNQSACAAPEDHVTAAIRIVDQNGRRVPSGKRLVGGQIFDVTVGPLDNELSFVPDTLHISVGDTVRWTWASDFHSVTSGTSCTADGRFCSPDNMNCEAGILNDTGFVYEHTFTQPGTYSYFCALHCFSGMTGAIYVASPRIIPTPRPGPTEHPRP